MLRQIQPIRRDIRHLPKPAAQSYSLERGVYRPTRAFSLNDAAECSIRTITMPSNTEMFDVQTMRNDNSLALAWALSSNLDQEGIDRTIREQQIGGVQFSPQALRQLRYFPMIKDANGNRYIFTVQTSDLYRTINDLGLAGSSPIYIAADRRQTHWTRGGGSAERFGSIFWKNTDRRDFMGERFHPYVDDNSMREIMERGEGEFIQGLNGFNPQLQKEFWSRLQQSPLTKDQMWQNWGKVIEWISTQSNYRNQVFVFTLVGEPKSGLSLVIKLVTMAIAIGAAAFGVPPSLTMQLAGAFEGLLTSAIQGNFDVGNFLNVAAAFANVKGADGKELISGMGEFVGQLQSGSAVVNALVSASRGQGNFLQVAQAVAQNVGSFPALTNIKLPEGVTQTKAMLEGAVSEFVNTNLASAKEFLTATNTSLLQNSFLTNGKLSALSQLVRDPKNPQAALMQVGVNELRKVIDSDKTTAFASTLFRNAFLNNENAVQASGTPNLNSFVSGIMRTDVLFKNDVPQPEDHATLASLVTGGAVGKDAIDRMQFKSLLYRAEELAKSKLALVMPTTIAPEKADAWRSEIEKCVDVQIVDSRGKMWQGGSGNSTSNTSTSNSNNSNRNNSNSNNSNNNNSNNNNSNRNNSNTSTTSNTRNPNTGTGRNVGARGGYIDSTGEERLPFDGTATNPPRFVATQQAANGFNPQAPSCQKPTIVNNWFEYDELPMQRSAIPNTVPVAKKAKEEKKEERKEEKKVEKKDDRNDIQLPEDGTTDKRISPYPFNEIAVVKTLESGAPKPYKPKRKAISLAQRCENGDCGGGASSGGSNSATGGNATVNFPNEITLKMPQFQLPQFQMPQFNPTINVELKGIAEIISAVKDAVSNESKKNEAQSSTTQGTITNTQGGQGGNAQGGQGGQGGNAQGGSAQGGTASSGNVTGGNITITNTPSGNDSAQALPPITVNVAPPSVNVNVAPPSVNVAPPSVNIAPPSVNIAPPSVNIAPPSVNIAPPAVNIAPPTVNIAPPSVNVNLPAAIQQLQQQIPAPAMPSSIERTLNAPAVQSSTVQSGIERVQNNSPLVQNYGQKTSTNTLNLHAQNQCPTDDEDEEEYEILYA
jgi:hypothetical protein